MSWAAAARGGSSNDRHTYTELWYSGTAPRAYGAGYRGVPQAWLRGPPGAYWWRLTLMHSENAIIADDPRQTYATPEEAIAACDLHVADLVLRGGLVQL